MVRPRDPNLADPQSPPGPTNKRYGLVPGSRWRDYLGNEVYNDYTVDTATGMTTVDRAYLSGVGFDDPSLLSETPVYFAGDLIGTTRRLTGTDPAGGGGIGRAGGGAGGGGGAGCGAGGGRR